MNDDEIATLLAGQLPRPGGIETGRHRAAPLYPAHTEAMLWAAIGVLSVALAIVSWVVLS